MNRYALLALMVVALVLPRGATAQLRHVLDLNQRGMEQYANLDIEGAMATLEEALATARETGVGASGLARTYLNLGVVSVGGFSDNGAGLRYFEQALAVDPHVQLDPLTSTPEVQTVFALAQRRAAGSGGGSSGGGSSGGGSSGGGSSGGGSSGGGSSGAGADEDSIPHTPIAGQRPNTPLPIFIEAPDNAPVAHIYVYYKAPGMRLFRRMEMRRIEGGFGVELPCAEVVVPKVEYYVEAYDRRDRMMGTAGSANQPFEVPIVTTLEGPPPSLPGHEPPPSCVEDECPPGMDCGAARGRAGLGDSCEETSECRGSLVCTRGFCVSERSAGRDDDEEEDEDEDNDEGEAPQFFFDVGFSAGLASLSSGMRIDRDIPSGLTSEEARNAGYLDTGSPECQDPNFPCLNLVANGFAFAPALEIVGGGYLHPRIALAAYARIAFIAGETALNRFVFGARLIARITAPAKLGVEVTGFLGGGGGQFQARAPNTEPFAISGYGNVHAGLGIAYRFHENVGIYARAGVQVMFPLFLFAIDPSVGVQTTF